MKDHNKFVESIGLGQRLLVLLFAVVMASACSAEDQADTSGADAASVETAAEAGDAETAEPESEPAPAEDAAVESPQAASATESRSTASDTGSATPTVKRFQAGTHYFPIEDADTGDADVVEVVEVFSYMCPHCATFQPYVSQWHENLPDNVKFTRIPVSFQPSWQMLAIAYYTAENLGILEESHPAMFRAIHQQNQRFRSMDQLAEFYSQFGVSKERFLSTAQSFAIDSQMRRGEARIRQFEISGTPSLVVDGTYRIAAGGALRGYDQLLDVADELIAEQRAQ